MLDLEAAKLLIAGPWEMSDLGIKRLQCLCDAIAELESTRDALAKVTAERDAANKGWSEAVARARIPAAFALDSQSNPRCVWIAGRKIRIRNNPDGGTVLEVCDPPPYKIAASTHALD